jgi:DNA-binding response OmpR family regulator
LTVQRRIKMTRILICTAEGLVALFVRRTLERSGYSVIGQAADFDAAVDLAAEVRPDLILMDTHLSAGDGIKAAWEITVRCWRPIILISSQPVEVDAFGGLPGGACGFLQRPFTSEQLLQMIARFSMPVHAVCRTMAPAGRAAKS